MTPTAGPSSAWGDILIFDNWRAMHGRNSFTGDRHYIGAYLNHEDLESKRRVLLQDRVGS